MKKSNRGGLGGKGLGALFGEGAKMTPQEGQVQQLAVGDIRANRFQPRAEFDEAAMEELKESVRAYGVLQPVLVRRLPEGGYELIAGERRLRAAKLAGLTEIPAIVRAYNDAETSEIALIENLQREDLGPIEEARAYARLLEEFHLTQEALSAKVGRSRSHIANFLRLMKLDEKVQDYLASGVLTMGQAKPLVSLPDHALQREAADYIQEHELTARASEALVKRLLAAPDALRAEKKAQPLDAHLREAQERLTQSLGTKVRILPGKKKSRIEIDCYGDEDISRILELLTGQASAAAGKQKKIEALRRVSTMGKFTV